MGARTVDTNQAHQLNQAAYRRLKDTIDRGYAPGRFVAIAGGQVVADAARLEEIRSLVAAKGHDPTEALVVQAGVDYPETAVIFVQGIGA
jgi:hypothetical protein